MMIDIDQQYSHQPLGAQFQQSKSCTYRGPLRSRRRRKLSNKYSVENFEHASRQLQLFHAHASHSLDSIMEHPEDDPDHSSCKQSTFFTMYRRLPRAKTISCLSDL